MEEQNSRTTITTRIEKRIRTRRTAIIERIMLLLPLLRTTTIIPTPTPTKA